MRPRRLWLCSVLAVAVLVPAGSACAAVEGDHWQATITTLSNKTEPRPRAWDFLGVTVESTGASLSGLAIGSQSGRDDLNPKPVATHSLSVGNLTSIKLTCKSQDPEMPTNARFSWGVVANGSFEASFDDGLRGTIFFETFGTGFTQAGLRVDAAGDLSYAGRNGENPEGAAALAASDEEAHQVGGIDVAGVTVPFESVKADARMTATVRGEAQGSGLVKPEFNAELRTSAKWDFNAHSAGFGEAANGVRDLTASHRGQISGSDCKSPDGELVSLAVIDFDETHATILFQTREVGGTALVENKMITIYPPTARRRFPADRFGAEENFGWDPPGTEWAPRAAPPQRVVAPQVQRRDPPVDARARAAQEPDQTLGVRKGARARYAVTATGSRLRILKRLNVRVTSADAQTGEVEFAAALKVRGARKPRRMELTNDTFGGEGDLKGLIVPAGLARGDTLYGVGEVTRVTRKRVFVTYREGNATARASYARGSGLLIKLSERTPGGPTLKLERTRRAES